jgi:uncharacterized protein (DUF697 family)
MRTDERIEAALLDTRDLRPLLMASTEYDLAPLRDLLGRHTDYSDTDRFATAIEARIAPVLPPQGADTPLLWLAAWVARRLGASETFSELNAADMAVLCLANDTSDLEVTDNSEATLLEIGVELARLRTKKLKRLRFWRPLISLGTRGESAKISRVQLPMSAVDVTRAAGDTGGSDILWSAIRGATGQIPLALWEEKLQQMRKDIGRFNIIVAGRTGVGKTTLIGAIFGREVGNTLMGRPRTRGRIWYPEAPDETDILRLCDTEGLEMDRYQETLDGLKREVEVRNGSHDPFDHIHVAWLCIDEPSLTVQPGEEALIKLLAGQGIPVIVVLTKAGMAPAFKAKVQELLPQARAVIRVRAAPIEIEGQSFGPMGLEELMQATEVAIPSAVETAWHLASRNLEAMVRRAEATARAAATAAGAAGATPIPIADAVSVFGIQVGMVVAISLQMGVRLKRSDLQAMAVTLLGALGLTAGGRILAGLVAKFIPGLGSIAGAVITGTTAAGLTYGLGRAYIEYLRVFYSQNDRMPASDELVSGFHVFWQRWKNKEEVPPSGATTT